MNKLPRRARTVWQCSTLRSSLRRYSTPKSAAEPSPSVPNATYTKLLSRTPRFLHPTLSALHNAPLTHITAFLLLHELTAVLPLFGLAGAFHYYHWLPPYFAEGAWVTAGVEKFGRYARRKGWIGQEEERRVEDEKDLTKIEKKTGGWDVSGERLRWVVEFATAYAVVKALLPLRIVVSVWGAPWFARWTVVPVQNIFKKVFWRSAKGGRKISPAAGTNAVRATKSPGS